MILDSSMGNLIREPEPKPSNTHNLRGEDTEGQIILDSSDFTSSKRTFLDTLSYMNKLFLFLTHLDDSFDFAVSWTDHQKHPGLS